MRTVTCYDKEFVVVRDIVCHHVGKGCDYLLLRREVGALLEFEVANSAGQGEIAVDSTEIDKASSGADACLLTYTRYKGTIKLYTEFNRG